MREREAKATCDATFWVQLLWYDGVAESIVDQ